MSLRLVILALCAHFRRGGGWLGLQHVVLRQPAGGGGGRAAEGLRGAQVRWCKTGLVHIFPTAHTTPQHGSGRQAPHAPLPCLAPPYCVLSACCPLPLPGGCAARTPTSLSAGLLFPFATVPLPLPFSPARWLCGQDPGRLATHGSGVLVPQPMRPSTRFERSQLQRWGEPRSWRALKGWTRANADVAGGTDI